MSNPVNFHANTMAAFDATKGHDLTGKPGSLTLEQVTSMMDGLSGIRICCSHALHGLEDKQHFQKLIDKLPDWTATICVTRRTLSAWHKWTHRDGPTLSNVQSFLWETQRKP